MATSRDVARTAEERRAVADGCRDVCFFYEYSSRSTDYGRGRNSRVVRGAIVRATLAEVEAYVTERLGQMGERDVLVCVTGWQAYEA